MRTVSSSVSDWLLQEYSASFAFFTWEVLSTDLLVATGSNAHVI